MLYTDVMPVLAQLIAAILHFVLLAICRAPEVFAALIIRLRHYALDEQFQ